MFWLNISFLTPILQAWLIILHLPKYCNNYMNISPVNYTGWQNSADIRCYLTILYFLNVIAKQVFFQDLLPKAELICLIVYFHVTT